MPGDANLYGPTAGLVAKGSNILSTNRTMTYESLKSIDTMFFISNMLILRDSEMQLLFYPKELAKFASVVKGEQPLHQSLTYVSLCLNCHCQIFIFQKDFEQFSTQNE